jgi:PAS domain S-box-containing protein
MLILTFIAAVFTSCKKSSKEQQSAATEYRSFRDIPGVTQYEINAIEALKEKYDSFVFAMSPSTEAFIGKDGKVRGFSALFCDWLYGMFGIPIKIEFYERGDLLKALESGDIDLTGDLMSSPELRKSYYMTSPIVERSLEVYRIRSSETIEDILKSRPPVYAFPENSVLSADVKQSAGYDFDTVFIEDYRTAYSMLKSGEIDAYFDMDTSEFTFDRYDDVITEDYHPLIFKSTCLSAKRAELQPLINIVEQALNEQTLAHLSGLYKQGHQQYLENKLYNMLTQEEKAYMQNNPVVLVAAESTNYPICFFDTNTGEWHGIYFEALDEISRLTGLTFKRINEQGMLNKDLLVMLENGEVLMMPELYRLEEYQDRFLWSGIPLLEDTFAFLSKSDYQNIEVNQIPYLKIGVRRNSIYSEFFKRMFPAHRHLVEYNTQEDVWSALQKDEVEVIFACNRRLATYTNFYEETGYKLNLILNYSFDSSIGYNKDAVILKSIADKALGIININNIGKQWMLKSYDYRYKLSEAQRPWYIGLSIMFFFILILSVIFLMRSRNTGKQLEILVEKRTSELAYQSSLLNTIVDSLPDAVFCKNVDLIYTLCNKYMTDTFGKKLEDMIGKDDMAALGMPAEAAELANNVDRKVIKEQQQVMFEEWLPCADGVTRLFETVKVPLILNNEVTGVLGIGRDMTQRKVMEDEIRAASFAKSSFLANMSHEIRTPLNVIIGLTDLVLEDDSLESHVTENLAKISNAGTTLLSIVNDILDFSKIESGKLELTPVEYYMASLLNDIVTLVTTRLGEKPIMFHLDIDDALPSKLYGDDLRVKQILTNLLTNSVKYTKQGDITLSVHCTCESDTVWMDIAVSDTGMGIREEDLKKLFSDYNQVDTKANRNIEGTGLGLSITKRLTEMMDGKISAESEYGKGSTFHLRLRQGFINDAPPIGAELAEKLRGFHYSDSKRIVSKKLIRLNLSYAKVLVVDDMQTNLDVASGLFGKYKMQVDCLTSGQEAVDRIRGGNPVYNAVFMDHMMPGMDGIETADNIRALGTEYSQKVPIIALTANAIHGTDKMFYEHGFQAFITKPIDVTELDSVIRKWVRDDKHEEVTVVEESSVADEIVIKIPGVDSEKGLSLYAGDTKVYLPMLRSYVANTPGVLEKLRNVSADTLPGYVISVHGLKGTSAGIGAEAIREAAMELEAISRTGDLQSVLKLNGDLIANAEIVVANVKKWLEKNDKQEAKSRQKAPDRELLAQLKQCFESYNMGGIDTAMLELERFDYEEGADLMVLLREKIETAEFDTAAEKITQYEDGLGK